MKRMLLAAAVLLVAGPAVVSTAWAHAICGDRTFWPTLIVDDPGMNDEASLPTIQYTSIPASAGGGQQITYGYEWDKTITEHFGIIINGDYITQRNAGVSENGWDNITLTLKDQFFCSESNEFMASVGLIREFAKTGSSHLVTAGVIDSVSNTAPTLYVGQGLGVLPIGYLRALGVTGEFGYQFSDSPNSSANQVNYSGTIQYSIPYLDQHVKALDAPEFVKGLVGVVEASFSTASNGPTRAQTTGTIAPGVLYEADSWQIGVEALIPANSFTRQTQGVGVITQFHLYLDDIFPDTIGKPIL